MNLTDSARTQVVLLHSNDIHSRLEHAAQIATLIDEERRTYGKDGVLAIDCGDHMDRMRLETEGSDGAVNIALLNAAGYEAATLGNNEGLTYSLDTISDAYTNLASFPVLVANMTDLTTGSQPAWMLPNTIIDKSGLRIGLVGVTAAYPEFYTLLGWQVTDPIEAVREQVRKLRDHVDVLVVMSHIGLNGDRLMAEQVAGIDLIVGAHTHHLLVEPIIIGETTICAAGKFGEHVGRVEIGIDPISSRPIFRASCVPTAALAEQPQSMAIINNFRVASNQRLSVVIAKLDKAIPAKANHESPLCNLLAAGLRGWTEAEIGIVNTGQLLGGLAEGDVTAGHLHALCPSPINPCQMKIAGTHLRVALEQSLLPEFIDKPIKGYGFRGEVLGSLAVDGMGIQYNSSLPAMQRLVSVTVNGVPLADERIYTIGTIDMFSFKAGYETLANAEESKYYLPEFIRDVIASQLLDPNALERCRRSRWHHLES